MRRRYRPPPPPPSKQQPRPLYKQRSWSPDVERDEAWLRRKESYGDGLRRSQSFSNDDLEELKGCIELGFGFETDSPELDPKLSDTLPALPFYCAVNRDDPETVKIRLRQWAQVVACSVQQFSGNPN
ncbi:hypothetical protein F3Y22_tig00110109pilonHSYRG00060 [Hibiscus syriacus]|uniref:Uncharacterized protein n=1 Tax=Hibiscus syriacus TaxID=106335 RepID=A0A6A3BPA1_HIBSY|nr:hypothetical protein F3Y22_tig00110109pilonHSYRG00060 [Hibiscus syriacus]